MKSGDAIVQDQIKCPSLALRVCGAARVLAFNNGPERLKPYWLKRGDLVAVRFQPGDLALARVHRVVGKFVEVGMNPNGLYKAVDDQLTRIPTPAPTSIPLSDVLRLRAPANEQESIQGLDW